jgi:glycosyltransferase involved in cell wall biosynthesis
MVSIFVQVYNTAPYLRRCLESVLALRGLWEREIVVIDDASRDGCDRVLEEFRTSMRIIRHTRNLGANATANEGYAVCQGKYLIRLDSDDSLRPNLLEKMVPLLEGNPEVGFVYGDVALLDEKDQITSGLGIVRRGGRPAVGDEFIELCMENFIFAPTTLIRRKALESLLPIPAEYSFLDWYVTTGIAHRWSTAFCNEIVAEYRLHSENQHKRMVCDGSGEKISFSILNALWADPWRKKEKESNRGNVYGKNYLVYADKYYEANLFKQALLCYIKSGLLKPKFLFQGGGWRRAISCFVFPRSLKTIKRVFREVRT